MTDESTPSSDEARRGGSGAAFVFLILLGLLWFVTALFTLMGVGERFGEAGLVELSSGPSLGTGVAMTIVGAALICLVGAWLDRGWGWAGILVIHGGLAILSLTDSGFGAALVHGGIACFGLLLFAMSRSTDSGSAGSDRSV